MPISLIDEHQMAAFAHCRVEVRTEAGNRLFEGDSQEAGEAAELLLKGWPSIIESALCVCRAPRTPARSDVLGEGEGRA